MAKFIDIDEGKIIVCPHCGNEELIGRTYYDFETCTTKVSYLCNECNSTFSQEDAKKLKLT